MKLLSASYLSACCFAACLVLGSNVSRAAESTDKPAAGEARLVGVQKIWDQAPHNAFTDLLWHDGRWFCVFREGEKHVSDDGALRVITSEDGQQWTSAALIRSPDGDLRDAKITLAPDNRLMLCGAAALHDRSQASHQSYVWYSDDGRQWSEPIAIGEPGYWIWRITWHEGEAYGVGYRAGKEKETRLYHSSDGRKFEPLVAPLTDEGYPNESSLLFLPDDRCLCLMRRDDSDSAARLGVASPPYRQWEWKSLGVRIGGPQLIALPDGRIVVGGRKYPGGAKTQLWWLDAENAELQEILTLPSGGDTSYPGLVYRDGLLWVSYYASHEGKTSIYLAKVALPAKK